MEADVHNSRCVDNGGKLVLPDFKTEEKGVDKTQKLLIMKEKEKSTVLHSLWISI